MSKKDMQKEPRLLGKWLDPHRLGSSQAAKNSAAPRDRRPLGQGFERCYCYLGDTTGNYEPELMIDNLRTERPDVESINL